MYTFKKLGLLVIASVGLFHADADPITYTATTTASGTLGTKTFTNAQFTITLTGDTSAVQPLDFGLQNPGAATFTISGVGSGTFTDSLVAVSTYNTPFQGIFLAGILDATNGTGIIFAIDPSLKGYNLSSPLNFSGGGGLGNGGGSSNIFSTSAGNLQFVRQQPPTDPGASFTAVVTRPTTPITITSTLPNGTAGTSYFQRLIVSGGMAPYTYTVIGGALPPPMTLAPNGALQGTPTRAGTYSFTIRATEGGGNSLVVTYTLTIAPTSVTITTPSPLPSGMATVQYPTQVLSATGGFAPYTFSLASGSSLPSGLTLSAGGSISGTPTTAGTSQFTVMVSDANQPAQTGTAKLSMVVRPFSPDLEISSGSLSFMIPQAVTTLPPGESVSVQSTDPTKILNWSAAINPSVSWLTLTGGKTGSTTPGAFQVALTSAASQLAVSTTPYTANVVLSCTQPSPCAGSTQNVTVNLLVSNLSPQLTVLADLLSFNTPAANPQSSTQTVQIQNTGGATVDVTSLTCGASFCVPGPLPSSLGPGGIGTISVQAVPTGLSPGFYFSQLEIASSAGTGKVPVTLQIQSSPSVALSPSGIEVDVPAGGVVSTGNTQFLVDVSGAASSSTPVQFTAQVLPGANWLTSTTTGGTSTPAKPAAVAYNFNSNVASLAAGVYYGTIRVTAAGALNMTQDFHVVLNVQPAGTPQAPNPSPAGLIFTGPATGAIPAQQTTIYASVSSAVPYQAAAATADGASWLSVSPATGTTSAASPAVLTISANPSGLAPGVYRGTVTIALGAAEVPAENVTLIVQPVSGSARTPGQPAPEATTCTPSKVVPTHTALVGNFSNAAAWPTPLEVQLNNDCGSVVTNGRVVTSFSNGDPPLLLVPEDASSGLYSATWTPRNTGSQITLTATATAPGLTSTTARISGEIIPNAAPIINAGGTVHAFTPQTGQSLAPGTWMAVYGSNLANQLNINNAAVFPTSLAGTSVIIGGEQAPLEFVSTGQVNALIPFDLSSGQEYEVIVNNNGALSTPVPLETGAVAPGVAAYASGFAEAQHGLDYSLITATSPARPGEYIIIYLLGMGATSGSVVSGQPSPAGATTTNQPTVTLNGENVPNVPYSGLTPTAVGLYQINMQVPGDVPNGNLTLIVTEGGAQTPPVLLPVHD